MVGKRCYKIKNYVVDNVGIRVEANVNLWFRVTS